MKSKVINKSNLRFFLSIRLIALCMLILHFQSNVSAQKIGVVLSGGGAGGVSHIGVLKALEENNIPIDFIAGTSIGALIGGLYAAGYTPKQIEAIFVSERFYKWSVGKYNEDYQFYSKKKSEDASWINFKFSLDTLFETNLPTSYINPFPVDYGVLSMFAQANASSKGTFDSLFIPFRCVGANISNRNLEIFHKGDLATAVRASMSYPFFLSPVEIDGELYFDGGIYNNFPADLMCRDFNPDFIIGSNSSSNFPKPQADNVLSQLKYMLSQNTNYEIECENGIIIKPEVDVNVFDFSKNQEVIDIGYRQAMSYIDSIKTAVKITSDSTELSLKRKQFRQSFPEVKFDEITISNVNNAQRKYITRLMRFKKDTIGLNRLEPKLISLTSDEKINSVYPKATFKEDSKSFKLDLAIEQEKKYSVSFGGNISNKPINEGFVGFQYNYLGRTALSLNANGYFGQFYSSALGGGRLDLLFPFPFYLKTNFISNRWNYFESDNLIFEVNDPLFLLSRENFVEVGVGIPVGYKGKLEINSVGGRNKFEYYQENNFTQFDTTDVTIFNNTAVEMLYERNSLNRKLYASKGSQLLLTAKYTSGRETTSPGSTASDKTVVRKERFWYAFKIKYDKYYNKEGKVKFGTLLEGSYADQPLFANYTSSVLMAPAFEPIPELTTIFQERYRAFSYLAGGVKAIYSASSKFDFRLEAFAYQPIQEIQQIEGRKAQFGEEFTNRYYVGSATAVFHTPVGPLAASLNYYNENVDRLSLLVHFGYILFNRKMQE